MNYRYIRFLEPVFMFATALFLYLLANDMEVERAVDKFVMPFLYVISFLALAVGIWQIVILVLRLRPGYIERRNYRKFRKACKS